MRALGGAFVVCLSALQAMAGPALDRAIQAIGPPRHSEPEPAAPALDEQASMTAHIRAQAARRRGDHREAIALWRDAVLADQANAAAWRGMAISSEAMGLRDAAASAWKRRLDLVPDDARGQGVIGESLLRGGSTREGIALLLACRGRDHEREAEDSSLPWTRDLLLMRGLRDLGHEDAADEIEAEWSVALPAAATVDPQTDRDDARWLFFMQRAAQDGVLEPTLRAAIQRARRADRLEGDLRGVERARVRASAARFFAAALALQARLDVPAEEIVALVESGARAGLIRLSPMIRYDMPVAEALWRTGLIALQLGNGRLARRLLQLAADRAPNDGRFRNAIGWVVLEQDGPTAEAAAHLEFAAQADPDDAAALDSLGLLRLKQGRAKEALPILQQSRALAAEADPVRDETGRPVEDPEILVHLGDALAATGDLSAAAAIWSLALEQLTGAIGRWRLERQSLIQRREWGLEVVEGAELYDLRFSNLEREIRSRLAQSPSTGED